MHLTAKEELLEQTGTETRALQLTEVISREFESIDGIELVDYQLVSEAVRWDYDYLSYRAGTPDDTAPAGV